LPRAVLTAVVASVLVSWFAAAARAEPASYVSPEVRPDRTVTFRIAAPRAAEVTFNGDWIAGDQAKPKLNKGTDGLWSVTLGPLPPGLFIYSFNVDGVSTPDPLNPDVKLRARSAGSIVVVPGDGPQFWDARDVPHGTVEIAWHRPPTLGGKLRELWVYLPPGYATTRKRYPVVYLLHGRNGTAADWTQAGLVNFVMDNLLAEGRALPMVIVMPWLHALPYDAPPLESNDRLGEYLLKDVLPLVEGKYRVARDRRQRALVGLSLGGAATLATGLAHPELFSHLAAFSVGGPQAQLEGRLVPSLERAELKKLSLLWLGCGRQDGFFAMNESIAKLLTARGLPVSFHPTEGVHNWALWRGYFHETAPLLFRQ
jgi:enterochelin esterase family protein